MIRYFLSFLLMCTVLLYNAHAVHAQTAPDIAAPDCHGTIHDIYDELDAGKIIVIGWTMPCSACVPPLLDVHNAVVNYAISNPGIIEYWINDDYGNTNCLVLEGWCQNNGISFFELFSTTELPMSAFGSDGMPKVVVMACESHTVYYNVDDYPSGAGVSAAIDQALLDLSNGCVSSVSENNLAESVQIYPNPASDLLYINCGHLNQFESVNVYNMLGEAQAVSLEENSDAKIEIQIENLSEGMYFIEIIGENEIVKKNFQVKH